MPRKPRLTHPLRDVRHCLNMTQPAFAKFIGCSAITVQRIENRTLKMSDKIADRILEATGVNPVDYAQVEKPWTSTAIAYTKQS